MLLQRSSACLDLESVYCEDQQSHSSGLVNSVLIPNQKFCELAVDEASSFSTSPSSSYFPHSPVIECDHLPSSCIYAHPLSPTISSSPSYSSIHTPVSPSLSDHVPLVILDTHFQYIESRQVKHDSDYDYDYEEAQEDSIIFFGTAKHAKPAVKKDLTSRDPFSSWLDRMEEPRQRQEVGAVEKDSLARLVQNPLHCRWATGSSTRSN